MRLVHKHEQSEPTPERLFASKYAWLMRWALHFAQNDRSAAEDLVQEAFVRTLLTWDKLHNLHDLEPLLYSYLKYAHLTERRRGRGYAFQSLAVVDSDTLAMSLRVSTSFDQIEVQNELRSILTFLLWRRLSAKFASVFLLRFFHGFFPEEIAAICLATRHSIDLSLRHARTELKAYLTDPNQIQVPGRSRAPELKQENTAVPLREFVDELRRDIFNSPREACPSTEEVRRQYSSMTLRPVQLELLSHLVTCESCLNKAVRLSGTKSAICSINGGLSWLSTSRKNSKSGPSLEKANLSSILSKSRERIREIIEHRPTGLIIALNGEIIASRDINSSCAVLKVETRSVESLCVVDVLSEQGVLMLVLPLLQHEPHLGPELRQEISLSDERELTLIVRFNCDGASIEATYRDPSFASRTSLHEQAAHAALVDDLTMESLPNPTPNAGEDPEADSIDSRPWWDVTAWKVFTGSGQRRTFAYSSVGALVVLSALTWELANSKRETVPIQSFASQLRDC